MKRFAFVLVLAATTMAHADRKAAEKYFRAGAEAYHAQNFKAAAEQFDLAYADLPLPEIAFSAAQAYRRRYQGDPQPAFVKRAIELYRAYLDAVKSGGKVREASDHLEAMQLELHKLEASGATTVVAAPPPPATTRLGVSVAIAGQGEAAIGAVSDESDRAAFEHVQATLDGKPIDPFALVEVTAGPHTVGAVADGYQPAQKQTVAVDGQATLVELELVPKPATIALATEPGAKIAVDGRVVATAPHAKFEVAAGTHLVAITHRGRTPVVREVTVTRGQELSLRAPLVKTDRRRAVPWMLTAAGASAGLALLTGLGALNEDHAARDDRDLLRMGNQSTMIADDYADHISRRDDLKTTTYVFTAAAIVTGALGLGLYLFDDPSTESVQVTPMGVQGRF